MKTIRIFLLFACLLPLSYLFAQQTNYPSIIENWTLMPDGSQVFHHTSVLHIGPVTDMGSFGEDFVVYNPDQQVLKINHSYTIQADGNRVDTPANGLVDVLPRAASRAPIYNHLREKVIVHTGLDENCMVYTDYTLTSKPGYNAYLDICQHLRKACPVKQYTLSISVPTGTPLQYSLQGVHQSPFKTTTTGKLIKATCTLHNLPAYDHSPYARYTKDNEDVLMASTYANQAEAFGRLSNQFCANDNALLQTVAEALTEHCTTDTQRIDSLFAYVKEETEACALTLSETNYTLRKVEDVINEAYGTQLDKLNVLKGLINSLNPDFEARISACFLPNDKGIHNLTSLLYPFVVVKVAGQQRLLALSATPNTLAWHSRILPTLTLSPPQPLSLQACDTVKKHFDLTPKKENSKEGFLVVSLPATTTESAIKRLCQGFTSSKKDLFLPFPLTETEATYTLTIPKGMKQISSTSTQIKKNKMGSVQTTYSVQGNQVLITRKLNLTKPIQPIIQAKEWPDFKALMLAWISKNQHTVIFSN